MLHGAVGGYDHGQLLAKILLGPRFHIITPSRFGYLHSICHPNSSWDDQARGYASLLAYLVIQRVADVAESASRMVIDRFTPSLGWNKFHLPSTGSSGHLAIFPASAKQPIAGFFLSPCCGSDIFNWTGSWLDAVVQ